MSAEPAPTKDDRWVYRRRNPAARMRLFCLPYAGGGASIYTGWQDELPGDVEVCAVELPGRRVRLREPAIRRSQPLVDAIVAGLRPHLDMPYALFGHSLGAVLAFELARALRRAGPRAPESLFLSGAAAPHLPRTHRVLWRMSDEDFLAEIRALGGVPDSLLAEPELMALFMPILRADFEVVDTYVYEPGAPLACPVHLYGGEADRRVRPAQLAAWRDLVSGPVTLETFPGGHFYLHPERSSLTSSIGRRLGRLLREPPAAAKQLATLGGATR